MHEPHEEGAELEIVEDGTNASHEPRQATGEADEGEHIPEIDEEFQREGEQQNNAMDDDSSDDDDDYHVPHNWFGYDFLKLSVNEGEAVPIVHSVEAHVHRYRIYSSVNNLFFL